MNLRNLIMSVLCLTALQANALSVDDMIQYFQNLLHSVSKYSYHQQYHKSVLPKTPLILKRRYSVLPGDHAPYIITPVRELNPLLESQSMLARGSALITNSGQLSQSGIRYIIHAGTGSMMESGGEYEPTLKSIADSIKSSLELAKRYHLTSVAIPLIGGNIFLNRIGTDEKTLVQTIITSAVQNQGELNIKFIGYTESDAMLFSGVLEKLKSQRQLQIPESKVQVIHANIVQYNDHQCEAIINAANMEMVFGGGLSGAIGSKTGISSDYNELAPRLIQHYYDELRLEGATEHGK